MLEPWASSLRNVKARMRSLFTQEQMAAPGWRRRRACCWMACWGRSGARPGGAGRGGGRGPGPWRQPAILGHGRWDADALRGVVRGRALDALADPDAALVIDEAGFLKPGRCGGARQAAARRPCLKRIARLRC